MAKPTPLERYWAKIDTSGGPDACWPWTGAAQKSGRGVFSVGGKSFIATRWGYRKLVGPIPDGYGVLHKCDTPSCMNPMDWFLGTSVDNVADKVAKGRQARGATHGACTHPESRPRGHKHGTKTRPESVPCGEGKPNSKLSDSGVIEIRRRCAEGESRTGLAAEFGISYWTLVAVVMRRTWKHVL